MAQIIVGVMGGIGVGKSEFNRSMKRGIAHSRLPSMLATPGELKVYEESKRVKDIALSVFYPAFERKDRYACFGAEIAMLMARIEYMKMAAKKTKGILIIERTPEENRYVFFENDYRSGLFGDPEKDEIAKYFYNSYCATYEKYRNGVPTPDVFVYLDVEPKLALELIKRRGRKSERNVKLSYLQDIHDLYEWMFDEVLDSLPGFGDRLVRVPVTDHPSKESLGRFHIQIEDRIMQALRRQGFGSGNNGR